VPRGTPLWLLDDRFSDDDPARIVDLLARSRQDLSSGRRGGLRGKRALQQRRGASPRAFE
jgi:hypothetical protein